MKITAQQNETLATVNFYEGIRSYTFFKGTYQDFEGLFYKVFTDRLAYIGPGTPTSWNNVAYPIENYLPVEVQEIIIKEKV